MTIEWHTEREAVARAIAQVLKQQLGPIKARLDEIERRLDNGGGQIDAYAAALASAAKGGASNVEQF